MTVGEFVNQCNSDSIGFPVARIIYTNGPPTKQSGKSVRLNTRHQICDDAFRTGCMGLTTVPNHVCS